MLDLIMSIIDRLYIESGVCYKHPPVRGLVLYPSFDKTPLIKRHFGHFYLRKDCGSQTLQKAPGISSVDHCAPQNILFWFLAYTETEIE